MKTDTKILIGAVLASVLIIVGGIFVLGNDKAPQREKLGAAAMTIDRKVADLGTMKESDEKTADFTITNTSNSVLRIWGVATSCDCTFATVDIGGKVSKEFTMAGMMNSDLANWLGEVPAGQKAKLTVIYRPKIMPVTGPVNRQVNFATNDPNNQNVQVTINANVQ